MTRVSSTCSIALALLTLARSDAQALVFSTTTDVAATPTTVYEEELHRFDGGRWPVLTRELLGMMIGDANGNGLFDDQPIDIDAAHASGLAQPGDFFLSTTSDFSMPDGTLIKDGDIFHFTGTGAVVDMNESFFESATGTSAIDVDAFAVHPNGDIYFSFAEDETTINAALIAQNGGSVLDEQSVFRFAGGATAATLHLGVVAVVALFNAAFGTTATTVVDIDGVEIDPANPGALLLTSLSTAAAFRGKVISTANGGTPFMIAGQDVGPVSLGLPSATSLDALAIVTTPRTPITRSVPEIASVSAAVVARIESSGWVPGALVQFVVTDASLPQPAFVPYPLSAGYPSSPLDPANALFLASFSISAWLVAADASGTAALTFGTLGLPAGINAIVQTIDLATFTMSTPSSMAFIP